MFLQNCQHRGYCVNALPYVNFSSFVLEVQVLGGVDTCWFVLQDKGKPVQVEVLTQIASESEGCKTKESWVSFLLGFVDKAM